MKKWLCLLLMLTLLPSTAAWGAEDYDYAGEPTAYTKTTINNRTVRYATVSMVKNDSSPGGSITPAPSPTLSPCLPTIIRQRSL